MPAFTLGTLMSEATAVIGARADLGASTVSLYANLAQLEVASMLPHEELVSTDTLSALASRQTVPLPADFGDFISLSRVSSYDSMGFRLLAPVSVPAIDNASEGTAVGVPTRFARVGANLFLYPTPVSADSLVLRYRRVPADMVATTALPSLHTRWHPAIYFKLCENLADRVLDNPRAAYYRNKFLSVMGATSGDAGQAQT